MAASRHARAGIPISVKLIFATSIVVAAAVGITTWFSQASLRDLTETQVAARRLAGEHAITRQSELIVQSVANAVAIPLVNNMTAPIMEVLETALRDDQAGGDKRVKWLAVVDAGGTVQGTTGAPDKAKLESAERLLDDPSLPRPSGQGSETPDKTPDKTLDKTLDNRGEKNGEVRRASLGGTEWIYGAPVTLRDPATGKIGVHGRLRMGVSTEGLHRELEAALATAKEKSAATRNRVLLVSLVVLAIGVLLAALYGVALARPIKTLTAQAERIAAGDLASRVQIKRRDELGVLAHTFNVMAHHIQSLLVEQATKVSLEKEMSLARQVQQAMLPPEILDEHGYLKVIGYCMPASSCGGDWWTYRKLSNGRMLLVVGDATGHGIHSAMIAATARGAVEALSGIDERLLTPEQVLRAIDSSIRQVGDHNVLMTAFAAVFDSSNGVLHYANAGQNFPYVVKLGATRVLEQASIIAASGNPLGDRNIPVEIRRGSLQLKPGDLFVCFTDGVVERANPSGKLFGDRRLRNMLTGQSLQDGNALMRIRDQIIQSIERHAEGALAEDDVTLVLCQFDPPATRRELAGRGAA